MMHVHRYYLQKLYIGIGFVKKNFQLLFMATMIYTIPICELIIINFTNTVFIQAAFRA